MLIKITREFTYCIRNILKNMKMILMLKLIKHILCFIFFDLFISNKIVKKVFFVINIYIINSFKYFSE